MISNPSSTCAAFSSVRIGAPLLLLVGVLICGGCLSKPALKRQTFAFETPPPSKTTSATGAVVSVRSVTVSPLFRGQPFVYRTGPQAFETDYYASFLVAPSQTIAIAARAHLFNSGRFQNVVESGSGIRADKSMEVYVSELYGDFSHSGQPAAVLSMRISFLNGDDPRNRKAILEKDYSRRVPVQSNTAAAVMAAWDMALGEIMIEAAADLVGG